MKLNVGERVTVQNMCQKMILDQGSWKTSTSYINQIISWKMNDERERKEQE